MRKALLLVNPGSRAGASPAAPEALLRAAGVVVVAHVAGDAPTLVRAVRARSPDTDLVVAGGGDGTLSAIAAELVDTPVALGVLPLGTANDFARTIGIPLDPAAAARVVADGHVRRIDVGFVNDIAFLNAAGIGLSADLAAALTPDSKRRFGRGGYLFAALRLILRARSFAVVIRGLDGPIAARSLMVTVGNGRHHGGGLTIAPAARIDDGLLDLYSLETTRLWRLALIGWALRSGRHVHWSDVRHARSPAFELRTRRPRPVNADGELRTTTPASFRIRRAALAVIAPAEAPLPS